MTSLDELRQVVRELAQDKLQVRGSVLGATIKSKLPNRDLKAEYGSLGRFVVEHCGDLLSFGGKDGGDDLYASRLLLPGGSGTIRPSLWQAFQHPAFRTPLYIHDNVLYVERQSPEDKQIQPLSHEEHKQIATSFLEKVSGPEKEHLSAALDTRSYWPAWTQALKEAGADTMRAWLDHRLQSITGVLEVRVKGEPPDIARRLVEQFRGDQHAGPRPSVHKGGAIDHQQPQFLGRRSAIELRAVVVAAIKRMGDEELRHIWLPTGLLYDALRSE